MTRVPRIVPLFCLVLLLAHQLAAQNAPQAAKEPQAVIILTQSLTAAGGLTTISGVKDFTAQGNITYYWAGKEVKGSANVRGRGSTDFRLDANLPSGTRSWTVGNGSGSLKEANGKISQIPYHNAVNFGALTLPYLKILIVVNDPSISVTDKGPIQFEGKQAHLIRAQQIFSTTTDPTGDLSKLNTFDIVIDSSSGLVLATGDSVHPEYNSAVGVRHEIWFDDYGPANGVIVPHTITELIGGQKTWTLQINSINFNSGLADTDFQF